jgi:hypothetical protein
MKIRRVMGQPFVYWVESESDPSKEHCVRWLERSCSCSAYSYKNFSSLQATGKPHLCKHLIACRDEEWDSIIETVKAEQLAQ